MEGLPSPIQPAFPSIDYEMVSKTHFDALSKYLATYLATVPPNFRSSARQKLTRLTIQQFCELSTDIYDDLVRRQDANAEPFLRAREEFHPGRNLARQKLAALPICRFEDLSGDVHRELLRRYPESNEPDGFAGRLVENMPRQGPSENVFVTNNNKGVTYVSRGVP